MAMKRKANHRGTVTQRGENSFRAQIQIDGNRYSHTARTRKEAQQWLDARNRELEQNFDYSQGLVTLEEFLTQWLKRKKRDLKLKTWVDYQYTVEKKIIPYLGEMKIREIIRQDIENLYDTMDLMGIGIPTINKTHRVLRAALNDAMRDDIILRNPARYATPPKYIQPEMSILEEYQLSHFIAAASESRFEALYYLAITTGMREGELLGLKWKDIKWETQVLHIQRQLTRITGYGLQFTTPKTQKSVRTIPLSDDEIDVLRKHVLRQRLEKQVAGDSWKEHNLLFTTTIGTPLDCSNLQKDYLSVLERASLPRIRFHDLRHTAASLMLNNGVEVIKASRMLGHAKVSTTLDIYGHLMSGSLRSVAEKMSALVTPVPVQIEKKESLPVEQKP